MQRAMTMVYTMHRTAPVTANLRDQSDAPSVIETAPMATIGDNGRSQKQTTLRTASSFAIRPGTARATGVFMTQAPNVRTAILLWLAATTTFVNSLHLPRCGGFTKPHINPRSHLFDPETQGWVVSNEKGRQLGRQAATKISRENIMSLTVTHRDKVTSEQ
jgi:hypothetical protein